MARVSDQGRPCLWGLQYEVSMIIQRDRPAHVPTAPGHSGVRPLSEVHVFFAFAGKLLGVWGQVRVGYGGKAPTGQWDKEEDIGTMGNGKWAAAARGTRRARLCILGDTCICLPQVGDSGELNSGVAVPGAQPQHLQKKQSTGATVGAGVLIFLVTAQKSFLFCFFGTVKILCEGTCTRSGLIFAGDFFFWAISQCLLSESFPLG